MYKNDLLALLKTIENQENIPLGDIPNIDLYMDQVTTFMDERLAHTKRNEEDKILTKTMINNYSKNDILPRPVKKKYTKHHIILLIFIYYSKQVISLTDIEKLFGMLHLEDMPSESYEKLYNSFNELKDTETGFALKKVYEKIENLKLSEDNSDIEIFELIMGLLIQSYVQKYCAEKLIDYYFTKHKEDDKEVNKK